MLRKSEMLKGVDPLENKKETFKEKLKYFCSEHCLITDEDSDGYVKPTLKLFLNSCYYNFRGWTPVLKTRMFFQRVFRKDHISDNMLWDADYTICKYAYKLVKAYKKLERQGYPCDFSEFDPESPHGPWGSTKEEYDQAIAEGKLIGGGSEAWEKTLDHIIMALEYFDIDNKGFKEKSKWYNKYFGMDPYDENNPINEDISYEYKNIDSPEYIGCALSGKMPDLDKVEWCKKTISHHNTELVRYAEDCVEYGFELFGKYLRSMWD